MIATIVALCVGTAGVVALSIIAAIRIRESGEPSYRVTVPDPDEPHASL